MARFSVYNHDTRAYDYFEAPGPGGTHAGAPPIRTGNELGPTPEQAAWPLPAGAKRVGSGMLAQGRIATFGNGLSGFDGANSVVALGVAAYIAWRVLR